jgi:hypothetical protein
MTPGKANSSARALMTKSLHVNDIYPSSYLSFLWRVLSTKGNSSLGAKSEGEIIFEHSCAAMLDTFFTWPWTLGLPEPMDLPGECLVEL